MHGGGVVGVEFKRGDGKGAEAWSMGGGQGEMEGGDGKVVEGWWRWRWKGGGGMVELEVERW